MIIDSIKRCCNPNFLFTTTTDLIWPYILVCCYGKCLLPGYSSSQVLLLTFHLISKVFHFSSPFSKDTALWSSIKQTSPIPSTTELSVSSSFPQPILLCFGFISGKWLREMNTTLQVRRFDFYSQLHYKPEVDF